MKWTSYGRKRTIL